jgi:hypothetical protein
MTVVANPDTSGDFWLEPWYSIADDPRQVEAMGRELRRELGLEHPLAGLPVLALARRQDCDDVLFHLLDGSGRVAAVHLTWTQSVPERPPLPGTALYSSFALWVEEGMKEDHAEFVGEGSQE